MDGMLDPHDRRIAEAWETLKAQEPSGDTMSPESNRLAFADLEFLLRRETRGIRFQLEMLKPDLAQQALGIEHTVVVFGSARFRSEEEAHSLLIKARATDNAQAITEAETLVRNARFYEQSRALAHLITKYSENRTNGRKFYICTGGGPGIMEAANRGAQDAGGQSIGLTTQGWLDLASETAQSAALVTSSRRKPKRCIVVDGHRHRLCGEGIQVRGSHDLEH